MLCWMWMMEEKMLTPSAQAQTHGARGARLIGGA